MQNKIIEWLHKNEWILLGIMLAVFILIRLPGVNLPLHQDEYKWPMIVNPANVGEVSIPHPPLSQFIYRTAGYIVGFNTHFRFVPLFFGTINLLLLYYFMRFAYGRREAVIASLVWIFSYFSILASLMVDTDGEIMPFFFLLALIGYYKVMKVEGDKKWKWLFLFVLACIGGFFIKVSFLLAILAIGCDFLWSQKNRLDTRLILKYTGLGIVGLILLAILLVIAHFIFPFFNLTESVKYWEHFWTGNRDWFQTAIQCAKAILYTSPFLILLLCFGTKEIFSKTKVFTFFFLGALFFYVILFDFSLGALDRYFQFVILPLSVFAGIILVDVFKKSEPRKKEFMLLGSIVALVLTLLQFMPHFVPPLHPKIEWVSRFIHLKWNFVYPFSGGSGPLGFYISFLFIALVWIVCIVIVSLAIFRPKLRVLCVAFLLPLGFVYNAVFVEEYLFGLWNGYAPGLLTHAVEFIKENPDIKMVITYNDNGGNEIREAGKYRKRLYVDPKFNMNEKIATLNQYKEHYFVLDVPRLDPTSIYQKYFDSCVVIYREVAQKMSATVYDCRNAPDLKI